MRKEGSIRQEDLVLKPKEGEGDGKEEEDEEKAAAGSSARLSWLFRLAGVVYVSAFLSMYSQWPLLFGVNGLLPAESYSKQLLKHYYFEGSTSSSTTTTSSTSTSTTPMYFFMKVGTAIPVAMRDFGFHLGSLCDLALLIGILSSLMIVYLGSRKLSFVFFCISWLAYENLKNVGQTFYNFQWDSLLLEFGLLCIVTSFLNMLYQGSDKIVRWAFRFLAFKLMLLSGAVKLQANCPTWNRLTALEYHFATQCLPTSFAWYAHQLPPVFLRFGVAITLLLEIPLTFLLVVPIHNLRVAGASLQVLLQLLIFVTGNYNFFNMLTAILMIPCFFHDPCDIHFGYVANKIASVFRGKKTAIDSSSSSSSIEHRKVENRTFLDSPMIFFLWVKDHLISSFIVIFLTFRLMFSIKFNKKFPSYWWLGSQVTFKYTWETISHVSAHLCRLGFWFCVVMLVATTLRELYSIICYSNNKNKSSSSSSSSSRSSNGKGSRSETDPWTIPRSALEEQNNSKPPANPKPDIGSTETKPLTSSSAAATTATHPTSKYSQLRRRSLLSILWKSLGLLLSSLLVAAWITTSAVGLQAIWPGARDILPNRAFELYSLSQPLSAFNSYGLFRRMTGVGLSITANGDHFKEAVSMVQRPELIIEALHPITKKWIELEFVYKPGAINKKPVWNAPYQPRLDWQMWFAALGTYENNPYIVSLLYKLLTSYDKNNKDTGHPEVNSVFLNFESDFKDNSPKEVRVKLYHYDFTKWETSWSLNLSPINAVFVNSTHNRDQWWRRTYVKEYMPSLNIDNPNIKAYLQTIGINSNQYISLEEQYIECRETADKFLSSPISGGNSTALLRGLQQLACDALHSRPVVEHLINSFCYYFVNFTSFAILLFSFIYTYVKDKSYLGL